MSERMSLMHMELVAAQSLQETPPDELSDLLEASDIVEAEFLSKFKDLLQGPPGKSRSQSQYHMHRIYMDTLTSAC